LVLHGRHVAFRSAANNLVPGDTKAGDDSTSVPFVDLTDSGGTDALDPARASKVVVPTALIRKEQTK
jgi:hypothetical protein